MGLNSTACPRKLLEQKVLVKNLSVSTVAFKGLRHPDSRKKNIFSRSQSSKLK